MIWSLSHLVYDAIGPWSEIKLEILTKYAQAYSKVIEAQERKGIRFSHVYIDAFAGAGVHLSRTSGDLVPGSPLNALFVDPPFDEYHFIDMNQQKVDQLREIAQQRPNVYIYEGDCNQILPREVFPRVRYEDYRRGLCLLDPYGLDLRWELVAAAGRMRSIEIFLNFPLMHMNRTVLWHDPAGTSPEERDRMNKFWGDESWQRIAYKPSGQLPLFGATPLEKAHYTAVVKSYQARLRDLAGFRYVPEPLPMRNTRGSIIYYLFFASHNATGNKIASGIFHRYRNVTPGRPY